MSPINDESELNVRKFQSQCEWETMFERLNQADRYALPDPALAAAPARSKPNWRLLAVIVAVMLVCLAGLLNEWLSAGTWLR